MKSLSSKSYFDSFKKKSFDPTKIFSYLMVFVLVLLTSAFIGFILYKTIFFFQRNESSVFSSQWSPQKGSYGTWKLIQATFWLVLLSMFSVYFLNMFVSIFISQFLHRKIKKAVVFTLQVISGLPSVIFGFFVLFLFKDIFNIIGAPPKSMLSAIVVLVMMILPTTISLTVQRLDSVSKSLINSGVALGLNRLFLAFNIIYRSQQKKIMKIIFYGFTRAIGEVTAISLVAGNGFKAPVFDEGIPGFFFASITSLSSLIGLEIVEYHNEVHKSALFAVVFFILLIVFITNVFVFFIFGRENKPNVMIKVDRYLIKKKNRFLDFFGFHRWRTFAWRLVNGFRIAGIFLSVLFTTGVCSWILGDMVYRGVRSFSFSALISTSPSTGGLLSILLVTLILIISSLLVSFPIALFVSIYLSEYAQGRAGLFARFLRVMIFQLSGSPTIIFGLFGLTLFVTTFGLGFTLLAASLTMILILLPVMIQTIVQNLQAVPNDQRNAALSLGLSRSRVIWKIVVPQALSGILISLIFGINKIIAESAALLAILGSTNTFPSRGILSSGRTLATHIYFLQTLPSGQNADSLTSQTAFIVLILILILNLIIFRFQPKIKKA